MFSDHPAQVDVCAKAGSLVMADARILHSAHKNLTDVRRTLILAWHSRPNTVTRLLGSRNPGNYCQSRRRRELSDVSYSYSFFTVIAYRGKYDSD